MTCGAVMRHPTIQQLDAVEISPEVVEGARLFEPFNDRVLDNPRVRLVIEDAKSFMLMTDQKYDIIISEPSNPWMAGVSGVFSREYYETCRNHLLPDGLMAQWVQVYETSDDALQTVLATYTSIFPYLSVWQGSLGDLILVGSTQPFRVDMKALEKRFHEPSVKSDMERFDLFRFPVFLAREIISPDNAFFVPEPGVPQHSDFYPTLEYVAQRAFFVQSGAGLYRTFDENYSTRPTTLLGQYLSKRPLTESDFKAFALFFTTHRLPEGSVFRSLLDRWQKDFPLATLPIEFSAKLSESRPSAELEALRMSAINELMVGNAEQDPELLQLYARFLIQTYRAHRSVFFTPPTAELEPALKLLIEADKKNQRVHKLRLAELAWDRGDDAACLQLGQSAFDPDTTAGGEINFELDPKAPARVLTLMVESLWRAGKANEAWELCQDAKKNGYAGKKTKHRDPLLEMTCRKVEVAMAQLTSRATKSATSGKAGDLK